MFFSKSARAAAQHAPSRSRGVCMPKLSTRNTQTQAQNHVKAQKRKWSKATVTLAATSVGFSALYLASDAVQDSTHLVFDTSARVATVASATGRCFWIYRQVLAAEYASDAERAAALAHAHEAAAQITLRALEKNGGIYIKLGQHVSALTYLLPKQWTDAMTPLQDRCPVSSIPDIEDMFLKDMGIPLHDYFSVFDPEPLGVASLAQVHSATVRATGEKVAVKMQHPHLSRFVPLDVRMTQAVFGIMDKVFPEYPMTWLGDELQNSIFVELDFTYEAENARNTAAQFRESGLDALTALRIPEIVAAEKRVLVMEHVAGARLDDLAFMRSHNIDTGEVSACLSHIFNNMIFTPGFGLHCDPHLGNLAIRAVPVSRPLFGIFGRKKHNFEIVVYDHGLYRYIPLQMKRDYAHFWLAILDCDVPKMKYYAEKFSGVKGEQKFRIFASAITGRDPDHALNYDITKTRDEDEVARIQGQIHAQSGVLEDLMAILASMPRMVLLILKTNDLTRNLDDTLDHALGPERTFLILARYCAETVYREALEASGSSWRGAAAAWVEYRKRLSSLYFFDVFLFFRNLYSGPA